jgi:hypothetical protein
MESKAASAPRDADRPLDPNDSDPGATIAAGSAPGSPVVQDTPVAETPSRPRLNTVMAAISRPRPGGEGPAGAPANQPPAQPFQADTHETPGGIADELDEWAVADQPTVALPPGASAPRARPAFLDTDEHTSWPPRSGPGPDAAPETPPAGLGPAASPRGAPVARAPKVTRPIHPDVLGGPRYAAPDGKLMPVTPPNGVPRAVTPDPRLERFQALREQRMAHEQGARTPQDQTPVAEIVRQWWSDLRPGLSRALRYQHDARASGMHPLPAQTPTAVSRLGDVFGRLSASTRELAVRAHAAAAPTLKRLHDQAEQAAQALIDKIEGTPVQQQAPFLGPGRIAVLFRPGVTVGQAQRLLAASQARPLRLIPRKHGFLALVPRGGEADVAARLKKHPYVRDVVYMEYDDPNDSLSVEVPAVMGMQRG